MLKELLGHINKSEENFNVKSLISSMEAMTELSKILTVKRKFKPTSESYTESTFGNTSITIQSLVGPAIVTATGVGLGYSVIEGKASSFSNDALNYILQEEVVVTDKWHAARGKSVHKGIDLRAREPKKVYVPFSGTVSTIKNANSRGGLSVIVTGPNGQYKVGFAHLSQILVKDGQFVQQGQVVAMTGGTGKSGGKGYAPHLHVTFKKMVNGVMTESNPTGIVEFMNKQTVEQYNSSYTLVAPDNSDIRLSKTNNSTKNFNYGNIRSTGKNAWEGSTGTSNGFVKFSSSYYGVRAAMINLLNYGSTRVSGAKGYELYTVEKIISKYAPPGENDTAGYINFVYRITGIPRGKQFDISTESEYFVKIMQAIFLMESGANISLPYLRKVNESLRPQVNVVEQSLSLTYVEPRRGHNTQIV